MADKVYLKCSAKEKTFGNGGSIIKLGLKYDDLMAFAAAHKNARGYVNLAISERKSVGQYGDTHTVYLDAPKPASQSSDNEPPF